ncbi:probable carboxylesterase 2 [Telopea speciosissima]|uniref:probable carboxylesterase 2 n=1 Tax=Telopea speciosissima TaxID=54955 RepID=UPI001CC3675C|nr:probable carboxylesterase 2 [Telopea speciosissima]
MEMDSRQWNYKLSLFLLPIPPPPPLSLSLSLSLSLPPACLQWNQASLKNEIDHEFLPYVWVYKCGRVERLVHTNFIPPSLDPQTGVSSMSTTERFLNATGGFYVGSPFTSKHHHLLNSIVTEANVVVVSIDYRLAPEHPILVCYDDSWVALQWALSHSPGQRDEEDQTEPWLTNHADFNRVFLAGDSAGANIAHDLAIRVKAELGVELFGLALLHPFFWRSEPIGSESTEPNKNVFVAWIWPYVCPSNHDNDDLRINPTAANGPSLVGLGCSRVLVFVAEKDILRDRGWLYYEVLARCGWMGVVEIIETEEENHVFFVHKPESEKARDLVTHLALFLNLERPPLA